MISIDTNILLYAFNRDCAEHKPAFAFLTACSKREDVALCELVLVELYFLLRNAAVVADPLSADQAASVCGTYRQHPRWRLLENAPIMGQVWTMATQPGFARRRIFDARIGLTLIHHGVDGFAAANTRRFADLGFARVWNPLAEPRVARPLETDRARVGRTDSLDLVSDPENVAISLQHRTLARSAMSGHGRLLPFQQGP